MNEIKEIYGENIIIIIGDKSRSGKVKYISTPNCRMVKILNRYFNIYFIDEFRTSKLNWLTEQPCENLKIIKSNGNKRLVHSILTCKMSNNRIVYVNRDVNAVRNMYKIVKSLIYKKRRPINFCRETKIENIKPKFLRVNKLTQDIINPYYLFNG
jgi:hypothetical protein